MAKIIFAGKPGTGKSYARRRLLGQTEPTYYVSDRGTEWHPASQDANGQIVYVCETHELAEDAYRGAEWCVLFGRNTRAYADVVRRASPGVRVWHVSEIPDMTQWLESL